MEFRKKLAIISVTTMMLFLSATITAVAAYDKPNSATITVKGYTNSSYTVSIDGYVDFNTSAIFPNESFWNAYLYGSAIGDVENKSKSYQAYVIGGSNTNCDEKTNLNKYNRSVIKKAKWKGGTKAKLIMHLFSSEKTIYSLAS